VKRARQKKAVRDGKRRTKRERERIERIRFAIRAIATQLSCDLSHDTDFLGMEVRVIETVDQIFIRPPRGDRFSLRQRRGLSMRGAGFTIVPLLERGTKYLTTGGDGL